MLGANLSDQVPGGPNLTLTLTLTFIRIVKTVLLANGHFAGVTPFIFVIVRRFPGFKEQNPLFLWVDCNIRIFANFRQNHLFSAGDKTTVFQNDRFVNPELNSN